MVSANELQKRFDLAKDIRNTLPDKSRLTQVTRDIRCYELTNEGYINHGLVTATELQNKADYHMANAERPISSLLPSVLKQLFNMSTLIVSGMYVVILFNGGTYTVLADELLSQDIKVLYQLL